MLRRLYRASPFARLNAVDWAQLHAKLWGAAWPVALFIVTPRVLGDALGGGLTFALCAMQLLGAVVSSVGLLQAARHSGEPLNELRVSLPRSVRGLLVEFFGVMLMVFALVLYTGSQFVLTFGPAGDQRVALVFLGGFTASLVIGRAVSVMHRRRKDIAAAKAIGVSL
ncbi:hypothetical protein [Microbacterium sp. A1-JK]|uniref:hypothetical protein n=1 Tax=Microbacterium sp. A1-JK TaxID=3177516 RepID=UPI003886CAE7